MGPVPCTFTILDAFLLGWCFCKLGSHAMKITFLHHQFTLADVLFGSRIFHSHRFFASRKSKYRPYPEAGATCSKAHGFLFFKQIQASMSEIFELRIFGIISEVIVSSAISVSRRWAVLGGAFSTRWDFFEWFKRKGVEMFIERMSWNLRSPMFFSKWLIF